MHSDLKYNYVFIGNQSGDDLEIMYADFNKTGHSQFLRLQNYKYPQGKIINSFLHHYLSRKRREYIEFPFKELIYSENFKFDLKIFNAKNPICFILYGRVFEIYGITFIRYLRKTYKECKVVCYLGDLLNSYEFSLSYLKKEFDIVFTFDKKEAIRNSISFLQEPFSYDESNDNGTQIKYDVTFVGKSKGRFDVIIKVYEELIQRGFSCDFHIVDVPDSKQVYKENITYNSMMSFADVLYHVKSARCVLEIMQEGQSSPTTRLAEAVLYGKRLLTNCSALRDSEEYSDGYVQIFDERNLGDVDYSFIRSNTYVQGLKYINKYSGYTMMDTIDQFLRRS